MIYVDDRAGSRDLLTAECEVREGRRKIRYITPLSNPKLATLCRLPAADAMFVGNGPDRAYLIGIEVKSIFDFVSSANTGRLQADQIPGMLAEFDVSWLLIYGAWRSSPEDGTLQIRRGKGWSDYRLGRRTVPCSYVDHLLFTLTAVGIHVQRAFSAYEASVWIAGLYAWWQKEWSKHRGMKTLNKTVSRSVRRDDGSGTGREAGEGSVAASLLPGLPDDVLIRAQVASQLPGLGYKRAVAAARHFVSVREMVNAPIDDWTEIPGVGPVIAETVDRALGPRRGDREGEG